MNLNICADNWEPLTIVQDNASGLSVRGLTGIIINQIAKKFNFSYRIIRPPDGLWGMKANDSWNGMIGQVLRDECQLALGPFEIIVDRIEAIKFSKPIFTDVYTLMTAINYNESKSLEMLYHLKAVECEIWICSLISLILIVFISYLFRIFGHNLESSFDFIVLKLLFSKPFVSFPLNSSNFIQSIFVISISLLWINLNSMIGVRIVTSIPYNPIDSYEDLADNQNVIPLIYSNSADYSNLNQTKNPVMLKLFNRILDHQNESLLVRMPLEIESFRNKFFSGRYALMELRLGIPPVKAVFCRYNPFISIHVAKKVENERPLALSFSKNKTDKQYLTLISRTNDWIDLCHTSGLIYKWIGDEMNEFIKTNDSQIRRCVLQSLDETINTGEGTHNNESVVIKLSAMKLFLKICFLIVSFCSFVLLVEIIVKKLY